MKWLSFLLPAAALHAADVDWPVYLGDKAGRQFSDLKQITPANVGNMKQVWSFSSGGADERNRSQMAGPGPLGAQGQGHHEGSFVDAGRDRGERRDGGGDQGLHRPLPH